MKKLILDTLLELICPLVINRLRNIKKRAASHITNIPGWRSNRKIIVIESDDWGSIRSSSQKSLQAFRKKGYLIDKCHYMRYDSLATEEDLELLFELLSSQKNDNGTNPIVTANVLVANPDFERIRTDDFRQYHNESIIKTFENYPRHHRALSLWRSGMKQQVFYPQSHGREHLNISRWLADLQQKDQETHFAFNHRMFGLSAHLSFRKRGSYLAAFDIGNEAVDTDRAAIVADALAQFEHLFGYQSKSFIAPNYVWDEEIEKSLSENKVRYLQGSRAQQISTPFGVARKKTFHQLGEKNKHQQIYLVRNCFFEPSSNPQKDWISNCLREIKTAFIWKKPAIISTHRVNFVGFLDQKNRDRNLLLFEQLLKDILRLWPEVEFMTSDQLGELIAHE